MGINTQMGSSPSPYRRISCQKSMKKKATRSANSGQGKASSSPVETSPHKSSPKESFAFF